jgi:hypothetical protein
MRDTKPKNLLKTFSTLLILTSVLIAGIAATGSVTAQNSPGQPVEVYGTNVDENGGPAPTGV